jgi:hypothetical protein
MFCYVSKKDILELLIENKKCISNHLIIEVFKFICKQGFFCEFNDEWRKKIKSTLVSLNVSWKKRPATRKDLRGRFLIKCSEEYVGFNLKLLNATERMDIDSIEKSYTPNAIEYLLESMKISH